MNVLEMKLEKVLRCGVLMVVILFMVHPLFAVNYLSATATLALLMYGVAVAAAVVSGYKWVDMCVRPVLFAGVSHLLIGMMHYGVLTEKFEDISAVAMYLGLGMLFVAVWEWIQFLFPEATNKVETLKAADVKTKTTKTPA
jgi:hypothetical protein